MAVVFAFDLMNVDEGSVSFQKAVIRLSHVSHVWRSNALAFGGIWSHIRCHMHEMDLKLSLRLFIERSRGAKLSLSIDPYVWLTEAFKEVLPEIDSRINTLVFVDGCFMDNRCKHDRRGTYENAYATILRNLQRSDRFQNLKVLKLDRYGFGLWWILDAMRSLPLLESIYFWNLHLPMPEDEAKMAAATAGSPTRLAALSHMDMRVASSYDDAFLKDFFDSLETPALASVSLRGSRLARSRLASLIVRSQAFVRCVELDDMDDHDANVDSNREAMTSLLNACGSHLEVIKLGPWSIRDRVLETIMPRENTFRDDIVVYLQEGLVGDPRQIRDVICNDLSPPKMVVKLQHDKAWVEYWAMGESIENARHGPPLRRFDEWNEQDWKDVFKLKLGMDWTVNSCGDECAVYKFGRARDAD